MFPFFYAETDIRKDVSIIGAEPNVHGFLLSQLSGGEQQRVNAARAFSNSNAKIILLDEPTASLDGEHAEKLMRYIRSCKDAGRQWRR